MSHDDAMPLGQFIGHRARQLRVERGVTLDAVAQAAQVFGVQWRTGRVGDFESGRSTPSLSSVAIYCAALTLASQVPVRLADLLDGDTSVRLDGGLTAPASWLRGFLTDELPSVEVATSRIISSASALDPLDVAVSMGTGLADQRAAKSLGLTVGELTRHSMTLWRKTFSMERDERAGKDSSAQHKGQVARRMLAELKNHVTAPTTTRGK
ncbi:helix-turn-helix domain-containing protein [Nocardia sp. CA-136227]|uniref:helix-turn-helix domain-containing protein n=1 Tax=Nocardia sp. CA-136227 TaxID=3239979 RepID=UPI003D98DD7F